MACGSQLEIVKAQGEKSDRDWTSLPEDILHLVLDHQLYFPDYVRTGTAAVCSLWRGATLPVSAKLRSFPKLLLLASTPCSDNQEDSSRRRLFTADRKAFHGAPQIKLPPGFEKRCCGSSFGWLAVVTYRKIEKRKRVSLGLSLLNPFTGATIRLPPIPLTDWDNFRPQHEYLVYKVVLSADPATAPDTFEAVAIYGGMNHLAYYKSGAKRWAVVSKDTWHKIRAGDRVRQVCYDALHYRGKFYGLFNRGWVLTIEPGYSLTLKSIVPPRWDTSPMKQFIVESSTGDLLVAQRGRGHKDGLNWERLWKIFKVIDSRSGRTCGYEEVKSLGDDALFVGINTSLALPVSADPGRGFLPGCRPNCVYFTDDDTEPLGSTLEMSCYSLDLGDVTHEWRYGRGLCVSPSTFTLDPHPHPPPIWIQPNFPPIGNLVP